MAHCCFTISQLLRSLLVKAYLPVKDCSSSQEEGLRLRFASAWIRMRYDHPTVACRVEYDRNEKNGTKVYETVTEPSSLQDWTDATFQVISTGISGPEWCNSDPPVPALPTLFLLKTSSEDATFRANLVLRAHHDIIDGIGTLVLFNNLFTHAAEAYAQRTSCCLPQSGGEWVNLSPPLRERLQDISRTNALVKENVEIASPQFNKQNAFPGKHQPGLSVTHAYHAAIAATVRDKQERSTEGRNVRYINYCLRNERAYCQGPYSTSAHPVSVYYSVLHSDAQTAITESDTKSEFMNIARPIRHFYLDIRDDNEHISLVPAFWAMSTIPYPVDEITHGIPARNDTPSVSISSMGILDKVIRPEHGPFQLDDPWVTGEELGTGIGLFLGTWKGRLALSAAYNEAWHEKEEVLDFLECCNRVTFLGLGVDE
ncbi:uncharacterized protein BO80DRAFT_457296 [Aspergillus ibericus CBS 121593]|uniref:CoA-dependent acyltransferase n=1 Tax=Aspergillus ibericus CBS 121593 TaxID=1448316 RepID=A0A395GU35_9EURO|nr:hypothetical protein BO80DRAFT_457296 [Aspergillus ibericus CBS 121593]RAK98468.1 hypothetical protein BO80DRAFT_457296 [Aspergillus ibericus CBS 121593]